MDSIGFGMDTTTVIALTVLCVYGKILSHIIKVGRNMKHLNTSVLKEVIKLNNFK